MNHIQKIVDSLNTLLVRSHDAVEGYDEAHKRIENEQISQLFEQIARTRLQYSRTLHQEIVNLGGSPEADTSTKGDLHRTWMKIKDLFTSSDEKAILEECIRGEEQTLADYEEVLSDTSLAPSLFKAIDSQKRMVENDVERLKRLRAAFAVATN
ncbi:MAG: PA2169 family four-helix-bundle protein [Bacteroidota bacterium]